MKTQLLFFLDYFNWKIWWLFFFNCPSTYDCDIAYINFAEYMPQDTQVVIPCLASGYFNMNRLPFLALRFLWQFQFSKITNCFDGINLQICKFYSIILRTSKFNDCKCKQNVIAHKHSQWNFPKKFNIPTLACSL